MVGVLYRQSQISLTLIKNSDSGAKNSNDRYFFVSQQRVGRPTLSCFAFKFQLFSVAESSKEALTQIPDDQSIDITKL